MKIVILLGLLAIWQSCISTCSSVLVGSTRVIFQPHEKETSLSIRNTKEQAYLVQSWVETTPKNSANAKPYFIVTPPLFRLEPGEEHLLRIVHIAGHLPKDKESVFWLNIKSIPPSNTNVKNTLQIAVKTRIKLFYRPSGLTGNTQDAYQQLKFTWHNGKLQAHNPSVYHVSLAKLKLNDTVIEHPGMIPPKDTLSWQLTRKQASKVVWQAINDFGGLTTEHSITL